MYLVILNRIDFWEQHYNVPSDFLMEVAERRKEEVIGWLKFDAETFGYEYEEDSAYITDEVLEAVNEEAEKYLDFLEEEKKNLK